MTIHTVHEDDIRGVQLPGRAHKMIVQPDTMHSTTMCAGVATFPASSHAPEHVHKDEEEILYVLSGQGQMYFDGVPEPIRPGSFMFVPKGIVHSLEATTSEELKVLYVFSPPVIQGSYDR
mgnify:CR=1 FL=1